MIPARFITQFGRPPLPKRLMRGRRWSWHDLQDLTTLFSDAAMTTPAVVDGPVGAHRDKGNIGGHKTQSTDGNRPTLKQRSDGICYLDYSGGKSLSVPASTALFNFLHDGTGGTVIAFLEWLQGTAASNYLISSSATSNVGIQITKTASTQAVNFHVNRGVGGVQTAVVTAARAALSSPLRMYRFSYKNSGTSDDAKTSVDSSLTITTGATLNAPATGNAFTNLQVANTFNSHEYGSIICDGVLTEEHLAQLYAYFRSMIDYPIPSTVDQTRIPIGQSNGSGRGTVTTTLPEEKLVGVYTYNRAEEFKLATVPEHSVLNQPVATSPNDGATDPKHGFALRAAKALKNTAGQDVLLVPCAVGGTSFEQWDTPLTKEDRTTLFGATKYRYTQAAVKGGNPVYWLAGHEASASLAVPDFTNGGVGTAYQTAKTQFIADLREHIVDAPIIFSQLSADDTLATSEAQAAAGEAQRQCELSIANAYMVVTHDVQRNDSPDDIHISRPGQDVVADRYALAEQEHILSGLGPNLVSFGDFPADKAWTKGGGWSIASGKATRTNTGAASQITQPITLTPGTTYQVTFTLAANSGNFAASFTGGTTVAGTLRTTPGTYTQQLTALTGNTTLYLNGGSTFQGDLSAVSVREVLDAGGSMAEVNGTGPRIVGATYAGAVVTLECDKTIAASATNYGDLFRVYDNGVEATVSSAVINADTSKIDITCSAPLSGPVTLTYGYRAGAASAARTDFVRDSDGMPLPLFGPIVATA
jgi:hypothetical protein